MMIPRLLVFLFFCIWLPGQIYAQGSGSSMITGKVIDAETGEPLAGVHVFLSSRLQGSTTGAEGRIKLPG